VGFNGTCRGVSYYHAPEGYSGECPSRIIMGTTDAHLIALDANTGARCQNFGVNGAVDLMKGIGAAKPNIYLVTTPPLIARDLAVVGTRVADNFEVGEPSGVIRAYDAITGKFTWAWDMGRPGINTEPAEGEQYTRDELRRRARAHLRADRQQHARLLRRASLGRVREILQLGRGARRH
jgi:glucose dehydrogenase